jgi:hypothetical protein
MQRPLSMILATLDRVERLRFHNADAIAQVVVELQKYLPGLEHSLFSDADVRKLAEGIESLMRQLETIAKMPPPREEKLDA